MIRTGLTLFCILYLSGHVDAATAGDALNSAAAQKICDFSAKAKKAAARAAGKLSNTASYLKAINVATARLTAYAVKSPGWATQALILTAYLRSEADRHLTELTSKMTTAVKAAGQVSYTSGRIDEVILLFKNAQHRTPSSGLCLSQTKQANSAAAETVTAGCKSTDLTKELADETDFEEEAKQVFTQSTELTGGTNGNCALTAAVLTAYKKDSGNMLLLDGLIEIASAGGFATDNIKKTAAATDIFKPIASSYTATHNYLSAADTTGRLDAEGLEKLLKPEAVGRNLKDTINSFYQYKPAKEENDIKKIATELFKIPADGSDSGFIKALKADKELFPTLGTAEQQLTMQLDYQQLAREQEKALQNLNQKANKKGPDCSNELSEGSEAYKKTEETCNKLTEAAACNANPICSYNTTESEENKKCKFDAKKATSNGVPVAQTQTGGTESTTEKCFEKKG
uniref:Variant surface glycoprotein 1125.4790 n=1 Tax=Trypanosoma brucei TaxID=5691 RepID=A0A1J0RB98_9TRYP|nr:variant surface glycoprotein 1125.4790 [Trypanosoma brucei]